MVALTSAGIGGHLARAVASPARAGSGTPVLTVGAQVGRPANTGSGGTVGAGSLDSVVLSACAVVVGAFGALVATLVWCRGGRRSRSRRSRPPPRPARIADAPTAVRIVRPRARTLEGPAAGSARRPAMPLGRRWQLVGVWYRPSKSLAMPRAITASKAGRDVGSANDGGAEGLQVPGDLFFEAVPG